MTELESIRGAYGEAIAELGEENKDIVVLDADLSCSTKTEKFAQKFPERFFNMGIAEANMMGHAAGLASCGKIPFASTFAVFATGRAYDQIRVSIAYSKLNVKIAATHAGITVGEDGASHQMFEDIGLMRGLPGVKIYVPADSVETRQIIKAAVDYKGPVYIRLARPKVPVIHDENYVFKDEAEVLREGSGVCIIACGLMVSEALQAAKMLEKDGISARVLNMHVIKPIDEKAIIKSAKECGAVVTAEEHSTMTGLGAAVAEVLGEKCPVPLELVGVRDKWGKSGPGYDLMKEYGLTAGEIYKKAKVAIKRS